MDVLLINSNSPFDWYVTFDAIRHEWINHHLMDPHADEAEVREEAEDMSVHDLYYWARDNLTFRDIERHIQLFNEPSWPDYKDDWKVCTKRIFTFDEYCDGD